jgi:RimJ/RimL family protein N-acetyltransferase
VKLQAERSGGAVTLHAGTNAMADLMTKSDLAFGAAGSSSWERCSMGLPSVLLVVADNQKEIAERLEEASACISLGSINKIADGRIAEILSGLARSPRRLAEMARSAGVICDGRGAYRAAMLLAPEVAREGKPVWLRPATPEDSDLLYGWQCEPATRKFMRNPAVPPLRDHQQWFLSRLSDLDCLFNIIVCDDIPSGSLRLDRTDAGAFEISIVIGSAFQGQGIALAALALAGRLVPEAALEAEVIAGNIRSEALFTRAGFLPEGYGLRRLPALSNRAAAETSLA